MAAQRADRSSLWKKLLATAGAMTFSAVAILTGSGRVSVSLAAQSPSTRVAAEAFEVASVKRNVSRVAERDVEVSPGGRFAAQYASLRDLVQLAYPRQNGELRNDTEIVSGDAGWIGSEHFDVVAKAAGLPPGFDSNVAAGAARPAEIRAIDRIRSMLRTLLADRFRLAVHHEDRDVPVYALVLSRSDARLGPRLHRVDVDCASLRDDTRRAPLAPGSQAGCGGFMSLGAGRTTAHAVPVAMIANYLERTVGRAVLDRTGLSGVFDIDLEWTLEESPRAGSPDEAPAARVPAGPGGASIFTALQEQLGLKLTSTKDRVDVLIIDHAERPTPD